MRFILHFALRRAAALRFLLLSLDTARAVAAGELLDLSDRDHVVVALDGVLERGSRNCELDGLLRGFAGEQRVNQAAADAVDDAGARTSSRSSIRRSGHHT